MHPDGSLSFTDIFNDLIYRRLPSGELVTLESNVRRPNGMALAGDGGLLICQGGDRLLSRREEDGTYSTLADRFEGRRLNSPNDVVVGPLGRIYFTDPPWSVKPEEREQAAAGVYLLEPGGEVHQVAGNLSYPNGLAFSPDASSLYVSNSKPEDERSLWVYDVHSDGSLGSGRLLAWMLADAEGVPDGMKVHQSGEIFCTGPGGVWVFRPDGEHIGKIIAPENPANCVFSEDYQTLFLTARTSLYAGDLARIELA